MGKLVDPGDLESPAARHLGSNPSTPTKPAMGNGLRTMIGCTKAGFNLQRFLPVLDYIFLD